MKSDRPLKGLEPRHPETTCASIRKERLMLGDVPIVERAFQLAESGEADQLNEIARCLAAEGYVDVQAHLSGPFLRRQLRDACRQTSSCA